jgi:hypothetical protein
MPGLNQREDSLVIKPLTIMIKESESFGYPSITVSRKGVL